MKKYESLEEKENDIRQRKIGFDCGLVCGIVGTSIFGILFVVLIQILKNVF